MLLWERFMYVREDIIWHALSTAHGANFGEVDLRQASLQCRTFYFPGLSIPV